MRTVGRGNCLDVIAQWAMHEALAGPFLAVARSGDASITLFDGLHRAAAWVAHGKAGRVYPLVVDVIITAQPAPHFEGSA